MKVQLNSENAVYADRLIKEMQLRKTAQKPSKPTDWIFRTKLTPPDEVF